LSLIRSFSGRIHLNGRKPLGPRPQIGSRNQGFLANLTDRNFAACNQLIEFRATGCCQPTALIDRVKQLIHLGLAIIGRDGSGDRARISASDGETITQASASK
jgi:hypothetical protein